MDETVQHRRDAQLPHPAVRLGDFHPLHRLRPVGPAQQLVPDGGPVLPEMSRQLPDAHPVDAGCPPVGPHSSQRLPQVLSLTNLLHQLLGVRRALGSALRRARFGPSPRGPRGFTPRTARKGQLALAFLPLFAHESRLLLALPAVQAFGGVSLPGSPGSFPPPTMPSADFCAAVREPLGSLSPCSSGTRHRPPEVSSTAFRAQPPDLRSAPLMDTDFAIRCPLVRRSRLLSGSCPSARAFAPRFFQTPPRGDALALR